jgi:hypothetical protein
VVDLRHVVRAEAAVLLQRGGLEVGPLPRHRPRVPHAADVRQRLGRRRIRLVGQSVGQSGEGEICRAIERCVGLGG